jgi:hypothetical protein
VQVLLYCVLVTTGAPAGTPSAVLTVDADGHALAVGDVAAVAEATSTVAATQTVTAAELT